MFYLKKKTNSILVTVFFDSGPNRIPDCDSKIQRLRDMGIQEHDARSVLSKENWNLEKATENLFS